MAWNKNGTPSTLSSAGDTITVSDLNDTRFNLILSHEISSGAIYPELRLNNDSGANYASTRNANGGGDTVLTGRSFIFEGGAADTNDNFSVTYLFSKDGEEKLAIRHTVFSGSSGAGTAPGREELVGKYTVTAGGVTRIDEINIAAGSYDTGSNLSALGTN